MKKFNIKVDGVMHEVEVEEVGGSAVAPAINQAVAQAPVSAPAQPVSAGKGSVTAPLQGTLQTLKVNVGDTVKVGEVVAIIEAMKMENDIPATVSGQVKKIYVQKGAKVSSGDVIMDIA